MLVSISIEDIISSITQIELKHLITEAQQKLYYLRGINTDSRFEGSVAETVIELRKEYDINIAQAKEIAEKLRK